MICHRCGLTQEYEHPICPRCGAVQPPAGSQVLTEYERDDDIDYRRQDEEARHSCGGMTEDQRVYEVAHIGRTEDGRVVEVTVHVMPTHLWTLSYSWPLGPTH